MSTPPKARWVKPIMGLRVGESSTYTAPSGAEIAVEILEVETFIP
jgi:transcription elongation GreA/GreB family factor